MNLSIESFNYGDVLLYSTFMDDSTNYVFLADSIEGSVYLAKILDKDLSNNLISRSERCDSNSPISRISYIVLKTDHFENLVVPVAGTDRYRDIYPHMSKCAELCEEDKQNLYSTIMDESANIPPKLKELVAELYS